MMKYKGYLGEVTYDAQAKIFHGEVLGLKDVITFQGTTVKEIEKAFKDSIDDYVSWCKERGEEPEKTFSGNLRIRISPDLHAKLAQAALVQGVSLNSLIVDKLQNKQIK
ncbi:type II toxin-antitoxin system HicB family antitoxin [Candidatus Babeliales bacterium]|nr:type II toxin-antitoxin system HicB family antitoxin [Candidatus Babeliales bacterium]MCF7899710.1 type II toxin-antitoxin system HicB family antitoxin [Candidatus Babeliales bacterium]